MNIGSLDDGILYHYTTLSGFLGIVGSRTIWATSIDHLNDKEEFFHGLEFATQLLPGLHTRCDNQTKIVEAALERLAEQKATIVGHRHAITGIFTASFTEDGDLLSQWRGYTGSAGVSLGFRAKDLETATNIGSSTWFDRFVLRQCIYEDGEKADSVQEILEDAFEQSEQSNGDEFDPVYWGSWFCNQMLSVICSFKNIAFREEREWRLIKLYPNWSSPNIKVRASPQTLVPYFDAPIIFGERQETADICLDHIVIGPGEHQQLTEHSVRFATRNVGFDPLRISRSIIPYRSV